MDNIQKQLIAKLGEEFANIFPLQYVSNILDKATGETLTILLSRYNHIFIPFTGEKEITRAAVPPIMRRKGLYITYITPNSEIITEYFKGNKIEVNNEDWVKDKNWGTNLTSDNFVPITLPDGSVTAEKLSQEVLDLIGQGFKGNIENHPDGEDLTSTELATINNTKYKVLKFADRNYTQDGMGYVILRKNKTFAEQVTKSNTIYEIRYNFDLDGKTITILEGCVLLFEGGSISNGTIVNNNTVLQGEAFINCNIEGTINNSLIEYSWWKTKNIDTLKQCISFANYYKPINISNGNYEFNLSEHIICYSSIEFNNSTVTFNVLNNASTFRIYGGQDAVIPTEDLLLIQDALNTKSRTADVYKKYTNCLLKVKSTELESVRYLAKDNVSNIVKSENIYIDSEGYYEGNIHNDTITLSEGVYIKYSNTLPYLKNVSFIFKKIGSFSGNLSVGVRFGKCLNGTLENVNILFEGFVNDTFVGMLGCSDSCYTIFNSVNVSNLEATSNTSTSYYFYSEITIGNNYNNIRFEGHNKNAWGAIGSNYVTNSTYNNIQTSRLDSHYRLHNLNVLNSYIGRLGVSYSGDGIINLINCKFDCQNVLRARADYGCYFNGAINVTDCIWENDFADWKFLVTDGVSTDVDWKHDINYLGCKELNITNLLIKPQDPATFVHMWWFDKTEEGGTLKYTPPTINMNNIIMQGSYLKLMRGHSAFINTGFTSNPIINCNNIDCGVNIMNNITLDTDYSLPTAAVPLSSFYPIYNISNSRCANSSVFSNAHINMDKCTIKSSTAFQGAYNFINVSNYTDCTFKLQYGKLAGTTYPHTITRFNNNAKFIRCYFDDLDITASGLTDRYSAIFANPPLLTILYDNTYNQQFIECSFNPVIQSEHLTTYNLELSNMLLKNSSILYTSSSEELPETLMQVGNPIYYDTFSAILKYWDSNEWRNSDGTLTSKVVIV